MIPTKKCKHCGKVIYRHNRGRVWSLFIGSFGPGSADCDDSPSGKHEPR